MAHNGNSALLIGYPKSVVRKLTASYVRFTSNSQRSLATLATKQKTCAKRTLHLCFVFPCAQPRLLAADRGYREAAANRGRLFFGYFHFGEAKESDWLPGHPRRF